MEKNFEENLTFQDFHPYKATDRALFYLRRRLFSSKTSIPVPPPPPRIQLGDGGLIEEITTNDVLFGRGGRVNSHEGNVHFRSIVSAWKKHYTDKSIKKTVKAHIAAHVVSQIRSLDPPGRFLKQDEKTGTWLEVGDEKARKKAGQALREVSRESKNAPKSEETQQKLQLPLLSYGSSKSGLLKRTTKHVEKTRPSLYSNSVALPNSDMSDTTQRVDQGIFLQQGMATIKSTFPSCGLVVKQVTNKLDLKEPSSTVEDDCRSSCAGNSLFSSFDSKELDIRGFSFTRTASVNFTNSVLSSSIACSDFSALTSVLGFSLTESDLKSMGTLSSSIFSSSTTSSMGGASMACASRSPCRKICAALKHKPTFHFSRH